MTVAVVGVTVDAEAVGLAGALAVDATATVEVERCAGAPDGFAPYLWVETDAPTAFEEAVRSDPLVSELNRQRTRERRSLYRVEWAAGEPELLETAFRHDLVVLSAVAETGEWRFRLRAPDRDALLEFDNACRAAAIPARVDWVSETPLPQAGGRRTASWPVPDADRISAVSPGIPDPDGPGVVGDGDALYREIVDNLEAVVWVSDPEKSSVQYVNPAYETVWDRPRDPLYEDARAFLDAVHPEDRDRVEAALADQPRGEYDEEYRVVHADGTKRWVHDRAVAIRDGDGDVYRVAGIAEDITERKRRDRMRTGLYEFVRRALRVESSTVVAERATETAVDALDVPFACVYAFDDDRTGLVPVAYASTESTDLPLPQVDRYDDLLRPALDAGEVAVADGTGHRITQSVSGVVPDRVFPLGDYGVLVVGRGSDERPGETAVEFAELLATNTEAAIDRARRAARIERQNARLSSLSRINAVIRDINAAVTESTTRAEIERNVCERFAAEADVSGVAVAEPVEDDGIDVRASAGHGVLTEASEESTLRELTEVAERTGAAQVVQSVTGSGDAGGSQALLRDRPSEALVVAPLNAGDARYGGLVISLGDAEVVEEDSVEVLRELGETIGRAIQAAETRRTLLTEAATELEFEIPDTNMVFAAAAERFDCRLELEGIVPLAEDELLYYGTVEGVSAADLIEWTDQFPTVTAGRVVSEPGEDSMLEFHVTGQSAITVLTAHGATIQSASADADGGRVVAEVASDTGIRELVNRLCDTCPSARLVGKRTLDRPVKTVQQFSDTVADDLTDKQLDILRAAYLAGYFEWPRESTGEDIADSFDLSSPTVHFHLRNALESLVGRFCETARPERGRE